MVTTIEVLGVLLALSAAAAVGGYMFNVHELKKYGTLAFLVVAGILAIVFVLKKIWLLLFLAVIVVAVLKFWPKPKNIPFRSPR